MSETEGRKEDEAAGTSDREPDPSRAVGDVEGAGAGAADEGAESEEHELEGAADDEGGLDEVDVRDLLRAALRPPQPQAKAEAVLLKGVQKRIRLRSQGKFYADGWSTSRSPRSTYLVTSIFMLVLIAFVFLVLIPWSNSALP